MGSGKAEGTDWGSAREQMFESMSILSKESDEVAMVASEVLWAVWVGEALGEIS